MISLTVLGCVYFGVYKPVEMTAGKETIAIYGVVVSLRLAVVVSWAVTILVTWLWRRERHLRKETIRMQQVRLVELEKREDPGRTSSGLEE